MSVLENLLLAKKRTGRRKRERTDGDTQRKSKKRKREPSVRSEGSEKKSPGNKNTKGEEESEEESEEVTEGFGDDQTQRGNRHRKVATFPLSCLRSHTSGFYW